MIPGILIGAASVVLFRMCVAVIARATKRRRINRAKEATTDAEKFKRAAYLSMHNVNEPSAIKRLFGLF